VVDRAAAEMGAQPEEVALVRNASEGLSALIAQVRGVGAGDRILCADVDYDSSRGDMASLATARGATLTTLSMPRQPTRAAVLAVYADAIARSERLKLVLLTQISHRTGFVLPVAEIAALARARGAVVVDAAQSFFHVPCRMDALGADAVVVNFHKWVGAPIGCAAIWIAKDRLAAFAPSPATPDAPAGRVASRVYPGTVDFSAWLTIPAAFDFQARIGGVAAKLPRLRLLRDRWVKPLRDLDGLEILTPDDPEAYGAITSLRIRGRDSVADNVALSDALLARFGLMTVHRTGLADGACVRVTPSLLNTPEEVDRLVPALRTLVAERARAALR
jgi:selenocysteine lyase/cysteine desulfurase